MLPRLRSDHPNLRFVAVGRHPGQRLRRAAARLGITLTGAVPDVRPFLTHAALVVAPLRIARGVPNKVLEAMAMARPVVTTPVGAEGLDLVDGRHAAIAPDLDRFTERVARLLAHPEQAAAMGVAGREHVLATHGGPTDRAALERALSAS